MAYQPFVRYPFSYINTNSSMQAYEIFKTLVLIFKRHNLYNLYIMHELQVIELDNEITFSKFEQ